MQYYKKHPVLTRALFVFALFLILLADAFAMGSKEPLPLMPWPKKVSVASSTFPITSSTKIVYSDESLKPLALVLAEDFQYITGKKLKTSMSKSSLSSSKNTISLSLNKKYKGEAYGVKVSRNDASVKGGNYNAVALGTVSLLQALSKKEKTFEIQSMTIEDEPEVHFRSMLIDVARKWHPIETLYELVVMARLCKARFIQLHLTDDQLFTFPSKAFPGLATKQSYKLDELKALVKFADDRGVTLIPELETPGHSGKLRRVKPFGIKDAAAVNCGSEEVYEAFEKLIGEICDVFKSSPYFHMGGDEVSLKSLLKHDSVKSYMKKHKLDVNNWHDLYAHHLVRINDIIKKNGKQTIVWNSFKGTGTKNVTIPKDIIVMVWENQDPNQTLKNGYQIVNAAWKPLYVLDSKSWDPKYLMSHWHLRVWQHHMSSMHVVVPENKPVLGAQLCSWEQPAEYELESTRWRLPAVVERIWHPKNKVKSWEDFKSRLVRNDDLTNKLMSPAHIVFEGLAGDPAERAFHDTLTITMNAPYGGSIRYTLDGNEPGRSSKSYSKPIKLKVKDVPMTGFDYDHRFKRVLRHNRYLKIKAALFDSSGKKIGLTAKENVFAVEPKAVAKIYYSPKFLDPKNKAKRWNKVPDFSKLKPNMTRIWPTLSFSKPTGGHDVHEVPMCSGVVANGKLNITKPGKYAFMFADNLGEVTIKGKKVCDSQTGLLEPIELQKGEYDIEVKYVHPNPFHRGEQLVLYSKLDGKSLDQITSPPKGKKSNWRRPQKGMWKNAGELLAPLSEKEISAVTSK